MRLAGTGESCFLPFRNTCRRMGGQWKTAGSVRPPSSNRFFHWKSLKRIDDNETIWEKIFFCEKILIFDEKIIVVYKN